MTPTRLNEEREGGGGRAPWCQVLGAAFGSGAGSQGVVHRRREQVAALLSEKMRGEVVPQQPIIFFHELAAFL